MPTNKQQHYIMQSSIHKIHDGSHPEDKKMKMLSTL